MDWEKEITFACTFYAFAIVAFSAFMCISYMAEIISERKESYQSKKVDRDFEEIRSNLKEVIDRGNEAIDGILQVASETESPRAYEVAAQMIKTVADANKDLLDIHKKLKDVKQERTTVHNTTNQSLFVGSTKELQMFLKEQKKMMEAKNAEDGQ